jgi:hypothetical protein
MITGAHSIIYSKNADADREFLRDVLNFSHVDAGGGWLIFALPPSEVAIHPADENDRHELYLMCDDIRSVVDSLEAHGVACSSPAGEPWGEIVHVTLPGGGRLGVYQPRHERPQYRTPKRKAAARKRGPGTKSKSPARRVRPAKTARKTPKRAKRAR